MSDTTLITVILTVLIIITIALYQGNKKDG